MKEEFSMLWKFLGLQEKLDALFDDGWISLGISSGRVSPFLAPATVALEYPGE
jgi:hypothetical protein